MVDLMPTILDVMEATSPKADEMQGESLRGHWERGVATPKAGPAFSEALAKPYEKKSLRDQRYKFILSIDEKDVEQHGRAVIPPAPEMAELYDLGADPGERRNLLVDPPPDAGVGRTARALDHLLREFASGEQGEVEPTNLDDETLEKLKSLGYLD
jgi:arylsulfatase A-like enzyme